MTLATQLVEGLRFEVPRHPRRGLHVVRGLARAAALRAHNLAFLRFAIEQEPLPATEEEQREIERRVVALYERDWLNVERGVYPAELARDFSWRSFVKLYPHFARDLPGLRRRARLDIHDDVPESTAHLPAYYRRNFHYQHKGYLSESSARLYDAQVELLFAGTGDVMRRQVLPPVVEAVRGPGGERRRVLDVACGTGGVLGMLAASLPGVQLYGLDLSPHYIAYAGRRLAEVMPLSLVVENAERQPFPDAHFDAVTSVYLMHEVPGDVRARILAECARVLRPGGVFVLADSIQASDAPVLRRQLEHFPRQFHEPYYKGWLRDDAERRVRAAGLEVVDVQQHFLTKVVVSRRA